MKAVSDYSQKFRGTGSEAKPANAAKVWDAFARVGYSFEQAVADLIDNSIDANATSVLVRFLGDGNSIQRVFIVDDGKGMTEEQLSDAMQFGSDRAHNLKDLGKYGVGLKSASASQCKVLTVVSRQQRHTYGRRLSRETVKNNWSLEHLMQEDASAMVQNSWQLLDVSKHGTIVVWEELTHLVAGDKDASEIINATIHSLNNHLGLVFHRLLESKKIRITIDSQHTNYPESRAAIVVKALDPFSYPKSGSEHYPKVFRLNLDNSIRLNLKAHIWPPKSKDDGYKLGGGKVSSRQGFYFYRNDRLIQAGGWNGVRADDSEPHYSLARVEIDLPENCELLFDVTLNKTGVVVPKGFVTKVKEAKTDSRTFDDYIAAAEEVYRGVAESDSETAFVISKGLTKVVKLGLNKILRQGAEVKLPIAFVWKKLPLTEVVRPDRMKKSVFLNEKYREQILAGKRASEGDVPVFKVLILLITREFFAKKSTSSKMRSRIEEMNLLLIACLDG